MRSLRIGYFKFGNRVQLTWECIRPACGMTPRFIVASQCDKNGITPTSTLSMIHLERQISGQRAVGQH
jgi:hypothetical protein